MPDAEQSAVWLLTSIVLLFSSMTFLWLCYTCFFYIRGAYNYRKHRKRKARKKLVRREEEAYRTWKRIHEPEWINYQFKHQTAIINADKLPGGWPPDCPTPPCEPPPKIHEPESSDPEWEDNPKWIPPPNFCKYWCSRSEKFLEKREEFDNQHIKLNKNRDEYNEWKRGYEEGLQRAIKNHPIAATFLNLHKQTKYSH